MSEQYIVSIAKYMAIFSIAVAVAIILLGLILSFMSLMQITASKEIIYIPTEANLPVVEAGRNQ